jgi:hypothetical protein
VGNLQLDKPVVEAVLGKGWDTPTNDKDDQPTQRALLTAVVRSAGFRLLSPELSKPVLDLDNISTTVDIKQDGEGRLLTITPVKVLDQEPLTPELCGKGLYLVAPILNDATSVEGEISFAVDQFKLPLDTQDKELLGERTNIRGVVELHRVKASLKNPLLVGMVGVISKLTGVQVPSNISVAENTQLVFHVKDSRVYHDGMTFMLPELSSELRIRTSGSVGLDESLDLKVVIPMPRDLLGDIPLAQRLAGQPLHLRIKGTLQDPEFSLDKSAGLLAGVTGLIRSGNVDKETEGNKPPLARTLVDLVGGLLGDAQERGNPEASAMLDRLRARREAIREQGGAEQSASPTTRRGGLFRRRDRR